MIAGPCCRGHRDLSFRVKGSVAAGRRNHDRAVKPRTQNFSGHIDRADIYEPARTELKLQKSLAIGAQRNFIVDAGDHVSKVCRWYVLFCDRLEVEYVEGLLRIGNQIIQIARCPRHWV